MKTILSSDHKTINSIYSDEHGLHDDLFHIGNKQYAHLI